MDTIFLSNYYYAPFNSTFYNNPNFVIGHPFINLGNDIATIKYRRYIFLLRYFNVMTRRDQSNILTHNINLNLLSPRYWVIAFLLFYLCCPYWSSSLFNGRLNLLIVILPFVSYIYQGDLVLEIISSCEIAIL